MRPERSLIAALVLCAGLAFGAAFLPVLLVPGLVCFGLVAAAATVDAWRARRLAPVQVERVVPAALALGVWSVVRLEVEDLSQRGLDLELFDHHPTSGESNGLPRRLQLAAGERVALSYRFCPRRRGGERFDRVELLLRSPWRMWRVRQLAGEPAPVKVYPDFRSVQRFAILAAENSMGQFGVRKRQRRGEGQELHDLREYRDGDSLRQIDWKATSRRDRVISRRYEDERNQQVLFVLDRGWRMRAVDDGEAHFDRALNSVLMLTYIAVRQGDAVGLMTLGSSGRWLPPQRGPTAMRTMLEAVYDMETTHTHPDFTRAATELMARQRRRALVILVTNLRDEDSEEAAAAVRLMRRRHLVLLASLREAALDTALDAELTDFRTALRTGATHHFLARRRRAHDELRGRGVSVLDVTPGQLPLAIVNRYLEIKRSGAL